jgi:hypothetical protein
MKTKLTLATALLGLALALPALRAEEHQHTAPAAEAKPGDKAKAEEKLAGYTDVSTALYKDDLEAAKKAAAEAAKQIKDEAVAKHYQGIADSKSLEDARKHFKELSDLLIPTGRMHGMHEMRCPHYKMNWLQKSADEVQNPYAGKEMPHCGKEVK